jgi:predicted RNA-binding Zn ribbon-like protein
MTEKDLHSEDRYNLETGRLCLDYANTAEWHASDHPSEHLNQYSDLVDWSAQVGILSSAEAQSLLEQATRQTAEAAAVLARAIAFREALYSIFAAAAHRQAPNLADLMTLNNTLVSLLPGSHLAPDGDRFTWQWTGNPQALDRMLWNVARSSIDLLTSDDLSRVGQCADERGCGWLFLDMSRNHTRQWCDMRGCGNRAKARRYYSKVKAQQRA